MLDPADQQQLDRLVSVVRETVGPVVVGAYLFGSAVLGGLRRDSDLDVLVVTRRRTTRDEKRGLARRLLDMSGRSTAQGRWRRVELTIVVESEVKPWRYPPMFDFQYGDWLRDAFEHGDVEPWPTRTHGDVAALIAMALEADTPLIGPPPATVLDPVPSEDLVRANVDDIERLLADLPEDTRNVLLTLARIWSTAATGELRSKDAAAEWAIERLPEEHRPVLLRARSGYLGLEQDRWDDLEQRVRPHTAFVVAEIRSVLDQNG